MNELSGRQQRRHMVDHRVTFLASPRSSYVTGATMAADGGATAVFAERDSARRQLSDG